MEAKEKAKELFGKYIKVETNHLECGQWMSSEGAKQCALIAIGEIMTFVPYGDIKETVSPYDGAELSMDYWQEVKDEINKL